MPGKRCRSHPPRETLGFPYPAQADLRVFLQQVGATFAVHLEQDAIQGTDMAGRQVQAFRASWRDDVSGIAEQKETTVLHRLDDKAAQRSDALFNREAGH